MSAQTATPGARNGARTREHILATALHLFATQGYEATTLRAIAAAAGCSLGLTYRYVRRKEDLVLALYQHVVHEWDTQTRPLAAAPLAARFDGVMRSKLALLAPYREALAALVGAALHTRSAVAVLGPGTAEVRAAVGAVFRRVVTGATDAPPEPQAGDLAQVLFGLHLVVLLVWVQDRSPQTRATEGLLAVIRDALALSGPLLDGAPAPAPAAMALARQAGVVADLASDGTEPAAPAARSAGKGSAR